MIIPIAMMFNDNYSIPASVAIYSLLANASKEHQYQLFVLQTNLSEEHKNKLTKLVFEFKNASIKFIPMDDIDKQFDIPDNVAGWPKEIVYKCLVADIFQNFKRMIVTDVDVVFSGDISKEFLAFTSDEYFAGVKQAALPTDKPFSTDITDKNMHFICGAGYMIYNLDKMRKDDMPYKYLSFLKQYHSYLKLPDQEILNIVSYPNIKLLHPRNMTLVTWYAVQEWTFDKYVYCSTEQEHQEALKEPIQIHYVTWTTWGKPWYDPINPPKSNIWFRYLTYTNFFNEYMQKNICKVEHKKQPSPVKRLISLLFRK